MEDLSRFGPDGELTAGQRDYAGRIGEFWGRRALSTDRCDRADVEYLVERVYRAFGFDPPTTVEWAQSPLDGALRATGLGVGRQHLQHDMRMQLRFDLRDRFLLASPARGRPPAEQDVRVWQALEARVSPTLGFELDRLMWDQRSGWLGAAFPDSADAMSPEVPGELSAWQDGQWIARLTCQLAFDGAADTDQLTLDGAAGADRLRAVAAVTAAVGFWWPMEDAVVLAERPTGIARDAVGRLHCEDGPALMFADSFVVYASHGTLVPPDMVHGQPWSVARILAERNVEVRRCAAEQMGWERFLAEADATLIAEVPDPGNDPHTLQLYELPEKMHDPNFPRGLRVCLCTNGSDERDGTRRRYGVLVAGNVDDPVAAIAETYGVPASVYRQLQVRR
ncbi:DUF6745 domain-containing protein [Gordonia sp. (in: high G+C Gram-positive bacteria)]|uniref:DUF6745 domain-containing protein n=2 Tax=Gordonia TaxID=2053 RepID=UPI0039191B72